MRAAVLETVAGVDYTVERSNVSSKGSYVSLHLEVMVTGDQQRIGIYEALRTHRAVRLVL